jgi:hypothetical protein
MNKFEDLKVVDLKKKLKELGMSTNGLKKDLVSRLQMEEKKRERTEENDKSQDESDSVSECESESESESLSEKEVETEGESESEDESDVEKENESEIFEVETTKVLKTVAKEINTGIRGKNDDYDFVSKYSNAEEALEALASEKCWRKGNKKETRDGDKQFYKCKFIKSSGCSAKCFLLYHNDEDGVSHYKTENNHNDHICENKHGIMSKYTEAIDSIYEVFHKPKEIQRQLLKMFPKDAKEDFPTDQQLKNYLAYKRTKKGYKAKLNLAEFEQWCLEHENIPESEDEMFVKRSFRIDKKTRKVSFFVFFTTKRLLSLAAKTKHICADTTYKLIQHGYPLLIVGTTDKAKVFHPFGIAMCSNEKEEAYTFIF